MPGNYVDIIVSTQQDAGDRAFPQSRNISKIVLERILVLAVAQEAGRDETKPRGQCRNPGGDAEQAENLDLARSVGSLSLVLRNQVDPQPGDGRCHQADPAADGTTPSLLPAAALAPAAAPRPLVRVAKALPEQARQCSGVIDGTRQSSECF